jgi:hypothetical protein
MPRHPVPEGYGSPCNEGEFVPQGTSSGPVPFKYERMEPDVEDYRGARQVDNDDMFDC